MIINIIPNTFLNVLSWILVSMQMAMADVMMNVIRIGMSLFQHMYLRILNVMNADVVRASRPDRVVASPYEGMRKGSMVIMKVPDGSLNIERDINIHLENKRLSRIFFAYIWLLYVVVCMTKNCYNSSLASIVSEGLLTKSQTSLITAMFF